MGNNGAAFKAWLDAYGQAWENRNPEAATALFTEDGTYQVTPFLEPVRGRKAIFEYWSEVARTEENIRFGYEILVAKAELNIARWSASFVIIPQGLQTQLDGIFLISLDEEGRCRSLREWWHKQQK
ncbi:MAG TPA: nuclear transport factor 2 family protein [Candidatus Acidoferrum sp.]